GVARVIRRRGGKCAAGLLMERELEVLGDEMEHPPKPFVVILGGAKVSDKINVIDRLLEKADAILIGGGMTYTFRLALGKKVGKSICEPDKVDVAKAALEKAERRGVKFLLAVDNIVATPVATGKLNKKGKPVIEWQNPRVNSSLEIPDTEEGLEIGPETIKLFRCVISGGEAI